LFNTCFLQGFKIKTKKKDADIKVKAQGWWSGGLGIPKKEMAVTGAQNRDNVARAVNFRLP